MRLFLLLLASVLAAPALAAEDAATGLAVNLPDTFAVEAAPSPPPYDVTFGVSATTGEPAPLAGETYLCQVSFDAVPGNAGLTMDEINARIGTPQWIAMAREGMASILAIEADAGFELGGYKGHEFIGKPTQKGGENVRLVLSTLETARGRTAISCVTSAERLEAMLRVFRTVRDGVTPPA
ncbi:hypothetical protein DMC47_23290 [Nostoc sp. 3335mG]|nr:hypothetical protein DMC47_23290 [Nostoc sp. 3335mG]